MAENLIIPQGTKEEIYLSLIPQLQSLIDCEEDVIADLANAAACLKEAFGFWWVGFYRVLGTGDREELVLGPFQGPLACTRIRRGRGVCGTAWERGETVVVPDVDRFPGHIACSSASRSEIVVPILQDGRVVAVLDIDSEFLSTFDDTDVKYLGMVAEMLSTSLRWR